MLIKFTSWLGDKVIFCVFLNIFIFYSPINNIFPNFLFYIRMYIKQIIEGTIGILICFFPTFENFKQKLMEQIEIYDEERIKKQANQLAEVMDN